MKTKTKIIIFISVVLVAFLFYLMYINNKLFTSKEFDKNGNLITEVEYKKKAGKSILHGNFHEFSSKGVLITEGKFLNDVAYGIWKYYDDDGNLKSVKFRKNDTITLEAKLYNTTGTLKQYVFLSENNEAEFISNYDEKGIRDLNGFTLGGINYEDKTYKLGDEIKYDFLVANIPQAKRKVIIENLAKDNSKVNRKITREAPCKWIVNEKLMNKGINEVRIVVINEFDKSTGIKPINDTLGFKINVQ